VLDAGGGVAWWMGDIALADHMYEQQVAEARLLGDPRALGWALFNWSHTLTPGQDSQQSKALRAEASTLFEAVGDRRGAARIRWISANLLMPVDPAAATKELEELLPLYRELDDIFFVAMAAGSLSWSLLDTGAFDRSLEYGLMTFRMAREGGDVGAATIALRDVEVHFHLMGHLREAAILDGAFDALCSRYGITTPPAFTQHMERLWPGPAATRDALGADEFDALRRAGAAMTFDALGDLIETTFAARQAGQRAPASTSRS